MGIGIVMNYQDVKQQVQEFCDEHRFLTIDSIRFKYVDIGNGMLEIKLENEEEHVEVAFTFDCPRPQSIEQMRLQERVELYVLLHSTLGPKMLLEAICGSLVKKAAMLLLFNK